MIFAIRIYRGFPGSSAGKESACNAGDPGLIPGWGRSAEEEIGYPFQYSWASLVAQTVKKVPVIRKLGFSPWVWKIPWRRECLPTAAFWPGEFHGQRSLAGYSTWGHKESDMMATFTFTRTYSIRKVNVVK